MFRGFPRPCSLGWIIGFYLNEPQQNTLYVQFKYIRVCDCCDKLFQIQITTGDIIQLQSVSHRKLYVLSATGTWDEKIELQ